MQQQQPLITPRAPAGEEAKVADLLGAMEARLGFVPDALRLYSISPPLLETFIGNVSYFNGGSALDPRLTAMVRYLVSHRADCSYCIDLNETFLVGMGADLDAVRAARQDVDAAPLPARERVLLKLALKSVDDPDGIGEADLAAARAVGWSDRDIFDVVVQAANNRGFNNILRVFKIEHQGAFAA